MKTTWLIGCMCKGGDVLSLAVLIVRGLDLSQANNVDEHIFGGRCEMHTDRKGLILVIVLFIQF